MPDSPRASAPPPSSVLVTSDRGSLYLVIATIHDLDKARMERSIEAEARRPKDAA